MTTDSPTDGGTGQGRDRIGDQEGEDTAPQTTGEGETAQGAVTRALAARGITVHLDEESLIGGARNTWLVIGRD